MSRPKKATVDYFPHDCTHKQTMFILESRYGNDGYAFWFKLLETLGNTEGHVIDCRNEVTQEFLQAKTRLDWNICHEILDLLAKLRAIDPELWSEGKVWSDNFIERIADVYKNRRVEIPTKPGFYRQKPEQDGVSTGENPQSKVKESKVNKRNISSPGSNSNSAHKKQSRYPPEDLMDFSKMFLENQKKQFPKLIEINEGKIREGAIALERLIRIDGYSFEFIKAVLDWGVQDNFWASNLRSLAPLRDPGKNREKKFNNLVAAYERANNGNSGNSNKKRHDQNPGTDGKNAGQPDPFAEYGKVAKRYQV